MSRPLTGIGRVVHAEYLLKFECSKQIKRAHCSVGYCASIVSSGKSQVSGSLVNPEVTFYTKY